MLFRSEPLLSQSQPHSNATVLAALSSLSEADQRRYFSLANTWIGTYPPPLGIFKTNALPCGENDTSRGVASDRAAIFIIGSRFNSSCQPNVNNYWDESLGKITFWATRDIAEGEELCICYCDELKTREDRRRRLEVVVRVHLPVRRLLEGRGCPQSKRRTSCVYLPPLRRDWSLWG